MQKLPLPPHLYEPPFKFYSVILDFHLKPLILLVIASITRFPFYTDQCRDRAGSEGLSLHFPFRFRHCEERSDEAIPGRKE